MNVQVSDVAERIIRSHDHDLQQHRFGSGLLSEIKPPIADPSPWDDRKAVPIEGEPLSETSIRERR